MRYVTLYSKSGIGRKLVSSLVIGLLLLTSITAVTNLFSMVGSATYGGEEIPGITIFYDGNDAVGDNVLNTSASSLYYGYSGTIAVNGSCGWGGGTNGLIGKDFTGSRFLYWGSPLSPG